MAKVLDKIVFDARVSERKILIVPIDTIKPAPYNPKARTKEGKKLADLTETVKRCGVVYPVLITDERELVDGHRRLEAAKRAGLKDIECIISPLPRDETFALVNTHVERMTNKNWMEVCRWGGGGAPKSVQVAYKELHGLIGTYGVDLLIQKNIGLNILRLAKEVRAHGTKLRLEDIIIAAATGRLTNKLNMEIRAKKTTEEKRQAIDALLAAVE